MTRVFMAFLRRFNVIMAALYLILCTAFPVAVVFADNGTAAGTADTVPAVVSVKVPAGRFLSAPDTVLMTAAPGSLTPAGHGIIAPAARPAKYRRRVYWPALSYTGMNPERVPRRPHARHRNNAGTVAGVSIHPAPGTGARCPVSGHVVRFMHPAPTRGGRALSAPARGFSYGVIVSHTAPTAAGVSWCHMTGYDR